MKKKLFLLLPALGLLFGMSACDNGPIGKTSGNTSKTSQTSGSTSNSSGNTGSSSEAGGSSSQAGGSSEEGGSSQEGGSSEEGGSSQDTPLDTPFTVKIGENQERDIGEYNASYSDQPGEGDSWKEQYTMTWSVTAGDEISFYYNDDPIEVFAGDPATEGGNNVKYDLVNHIMNVVETASSVNCYFKIFEDSDTHAISYGLWLFGNSSGTGGGNYIPAGEKNTFYVYDRYQLLGESIDNVYVYGFDQPAGAPEMTWPGTHEGISAHVLGKTNVYKIQLDSVYPSFVVNGGDGNNQTENVTDLYDHIGDVLVVENNIVEGQEKQYTTYWLDASAFDDYPETDGYYIVGSKSNWTFTGATKMGAGDEQNYAVLLKYQASKDEEFKVKGYFEGDFDWYGVGENNENYVSDSDKEVDIYLSKDGHVYVSDSGTPTGTGFGLSVNGVDVPGTKTEEQSEGRDQYLVSGLSLHANDVVKVRNLENEDAWAPDVEEASFGGNVSSYLTVTTSEYTVKQDCKVDVYIKIKGESASNDAVYFGLAEAEKEFSYQIGTGSKVTFGEEEKDTNPPEGYKAQYTLSFGNVTKDTLITFFDGENELKVSAGKNEVSNNASFNTKTKELKVVMDANEVTCYFKIGNDNGYSIWLTGNTSGKGGGDFTPAGETTNYYLNAGVWNTDSAWFAAYCFGENGDTWVKMELVSNNYYVAPLDTTNYTGLIFVRMNKEATEMNWDNKWNQTADLTLGSQNCYEITGWGQMGGNSEGQWTTYNA